MFVSIDFSRNVFLWFIIFILVLVCCSIRSYTYEISMKKFFFISFVCKQQRSIIFCYHFSIHNWKLHQNKTDMFYFISADVCLSSAMNESRKNFFMPPTSVGIKQWSRLFLRYCSNSSLCKCCVHFFSS